MEKILNNERKNLEKNTLLKRADQKNNVFNKTYQKGLAIYEKLSKLYKCSYDNSKIILEELDAYIDIPFNVESIKCEDSNTKKRLVKMVKKKCLIF